MKEVEIYVEAFLKKFKNHQGYSEMGEDSMKKSVQGYFQESFDRELSTISKIMQNEEDLGKKVTKKDQKKLFDYVDSVLNKRFASLAFTGETKPKKKDLN